MTATGRYIAQLNCERRMSARTLVQIFNDDGTGTLSDGDIASFQDAILDAESEVEQVIAKTYGVLGLDKLRVMGTNCPRSVKRMALDLFEVRAVKRHPEYIRADWQGREDRVEKDLDRLRVRELELEPGADTNETRLEPAKNEGGEVRSGNPLEPTPRPKVFADGMGAF